MALTRVSPALFQVSNNITSVTVGGSANTISLTFDSNGVITGASNNAVSVANTAITGNIISSQITSVANTQITGTITGSQISSNTLSNTVFQTGSVENYMSAAGLGFGMRNRIINGAMVIDQRNAGASITPGDGQYSVDRWSCRLSQSSKYTVTQDSSANTVAGFTSSLKVTSSSAYTVLTGDYFAVEHNIEGYNTSDLAWGSASAKTVTLSFWVRSSLTGTFGGGIRNGTGSQYTYPFSYTISTANTWEQKTISIAAPTSTWNSNTTNGLGVIVTFGLGVGATYSGTAGAWTSSVNALSATGATSVVGTSGATWYITGVQFEKGSTATPFGFRHYGTELALCQRYFQTWGGSTSEDRLPFLGIGYNSTTLEGVFTFQQPMRSAPTLSTTSTFAFNDVASNNAVTSFILDQVGLASSRLRSAGGSSGLTQFRPYILVTTNSSSRFQLNAEL